MENYQAIESLPRRKFYAAVVYILNALMGIALAIPAIAYLLAPSRKRQQDQWVEAGDVTTLAPNAPVEMSFRKSRIDGWRTISEKSTAWVVKKPDGQLVAYGPQCTHLGCAYHWDEKQTQFVCPCHTTLFSIDGKVISGPAPRPLDRYAIKLEGTKLMVGDLHHA